MDNRELLNELARFWEINLTILDNPSFDTAIIGTTYDNRVVYDFDKMVEELMETDNCSYDDAVDFISNDTIKSLSFMPNPPIVVYRLQQE